MFQVNPHLAGKEHIHTVPSIALMKQNLLRRYRLALPARNQLRQLTIRQGLEKGDLPEAPGQCGHRPWSPADRRSADRGAATWPAATARQHPATRGGRE